MNLAANRLYECSWILHNKILDTCRITTCVDVGANVGGITDSFVYRGYTTHAFEPVPFAFKELQARFKDNKKVILNNVGLSDAAATIKDVRIWSAWTLAPTGATDLGLSVGLPENQPFDMKLIVFDDYAVEKKLKKIDYVKIDVDGYEPKVLKGMLKTISKDRPPIVCELSCYYEKMGNPVEAFVDQVIALGYHFVSMSGTFHTANRAEILSLWPYHTSFDVMLLPEEKLELRKI